MAYKVKVNCKLRVADEEVPRWKQNIQPAAAWHIHDCTVMGKEKLSPPFLWCLCEHSGQIWLKGRAGQELGHHTGPRTRGTFHSLDGSHCSSWHRAETKNAAKANVYARKLFAATVPARLERESKAWSWKLQCQRLDDEAQLQCHLSIDFFYCHHQFSFCF